jgi:hypothetical protein
MPITQKTKKKRHKNTEMQTLEEIDARIEAQRAVATQARASLAALTETRAALKRKAEAQKPAENLVQRARRLKLEKEARDKAAVDAEERAAVEKFKAPILSATPAQLRAVYDTIIAEVLENMPVHGTTWTVATSVWFSSDGDVMGLLDGSGLLAADFHFKMQHRFVGNIETRLARLIKHVISIFSTDGLEIIWKHEAPMYSHVFAPFVLQCRAL